MFQINNLRNNYPHCFLQNQLSGTGDFDKNTF